VGLTLEMEQRLAAVGLIEYFDANRKFWQGLAKQSYDFMSGNFPDGSVVRRDDVAKALKPIVEVDEGLRAKLNEDKLTQKYWIAYFTDLVIERTWADISKEKKK
jgi:hypothetical protein